jgi:RND superfamily putative drug exporter
MSKIKGFGNSRRTAGFTERLARASATHPWRTIGVWALLVVLGVLAIGSLLGGSLTSDSKFRAAKPDSLVGQELLQDRMTGPQKTTDFVIVRSADLTVEDPGFKAYVDRLTGTIRDLGPSVVQSVSTYYETKDPTVVSRDKHATLIPVVMAGSVDDALKHVDKLHETVMAAQGGGFRIAQTGDASLNEMFTNLAEKDLQRGEIFGVPAALIVLLIVFGAVLAACMPLLLTVISIILALAITALIGQVYPMNIFVLNILTMMGLAVGIDYTLFVISRYREERARGLEKIEAIAVTGATANRAIFFSGMTVVLAMIGMVIIPIDVMIGMGVGVMLVCFTTLITALIALPALLSLLGDRVNSLRVPFIGRYVTKRMNGHVGIWERLSHSIMRRPVVWLAVAAVALLALAAPALVLETGSPTQSAALLPDNQYAKQGWDVLDRDFSLGKANPVMIVVDGPAASPRVKQAVTRLESAMKSDGHFGPAQVSVNKAGDLTLVTTMLAGDPVGEATQTIVKDLRSDLVPGAFANVPARVYVTGNTAGVVDYLNFFGSWMPVALVVVLSLSFVLLLVAFRSIVIPAQAIAMNLLSVGASYGLLVLVFQKGVGAGLLGLTQVDTIEAWVPLMLFSLLFGLSMDYQVFLLSRIKERYDVTGDTREAVAHGLGNTGGIITGAAAIMVCVFGGMATGEMVQFQQMGFGLAVAIFIDATVVRTIIVPAAMELLGERNWYLPRWLEWLPNVSVEGRVPAGEAALPEQAVSGVESIPATPGAVPALAGAAVRAGSPVQAGAYGFHHLAARPQAAAVPARRRGDDGRESGTMS